MSEPRREIIVVMSARSLLEYLTGQRVLTNVPAGAVLTSVWMQANWIDGVTAEAGLALRIAHESFEAVRPGTRIPRVKARFHTIVDTDAD